MLAIILDNGIEYVSPVFAIGKTSLKEEVLAFDKECNYLKRIKKWRSSRKVFIVKWENFPSERNGWQGYDLVLEDKQLWRKLCFKRNASLQDFPQFKPFIEE